MSKIARAARADCFTTVVHPPFKLSRSAPAVDHYLLTEAPLGRFILKAGMIRLFGKKIVVHSRGGSRKFEGGVHNCGETVRARSARNFAH